MFKVTKYPHGTFCWADCMSTDAARAKAFYEAVMGWTSEDRPIGQGMVYTMFHHDGEAVAGLSQMSPEMIARGVPSFWSNYISVDDVDALPEKVRELGGTVVAEPFDVMGEGRMMSIQDSTGAAVAFWQAVNHIGTSLVNTPGAMTWNELATRDVEKAKEFYGGLFGWTFGVDEASGYTYFLNKGRMNGGLLQMNEEWGEMPPAWMVYFSVADLDKTVELAQANGGNVVMPRMEAPGTGYFALIADPAGAVATYMQLNAPDPWEG